MKTLILTGLILAGLASGVRAEGAPPPNSEQPEISTHILTPTPIRMEQGGNVVNTGCLVAGTPGWNPDLQPQMPVNCSNPNAGTSREPLENKQPDSAYPQSLPE
jgi:hypothetical protein